MLIKTMVLQNIQVATEWYGKLKTVTTQSVKLNGIKGNQVIFIIYVVTELGGFSPLPLDSKISNALLRK